MIGIEIVEGCNNKCFFCKAKDIKKNKFMDKNLFFHIIDQCHLLKIKNIDLIPDKGEPFLHPNIYEFLSYLDKLNFNILIFTNLTMIDIKKLESLKLKNFNLNISHYGNNEKEYIFHTGTNKRQYQKYLSQLVELKTSSINYVLESRTIDTYHFDYIDGPVKKIEPYPGTCKFHYNPKIYYDGKITFCKFVNSNISSPIFFDQISVNSDLFNILTSRERYNFFKEQYYCKNFCSNYMDTCSFNISLIDLKLMTISKKNWESYEPDK
jgi:MoaA/NifB/PqqE/SkfB family radical SAM enzyme